MMTNNTFLNDTTVEGAKARELQDDIERQKLESIKDQRITGGDQFVGEEYTQKELGEEDIEAFARELEQKYGNLGPYEIQYSRMITMAIGGSLVGALACLLYFNKTQYDNYFQQVMCGTFIGALAGMCFTSCLECYFVYQSEANDPFKQQLQRQKETLRRMEMMVKERHDEVIYYDNGTQHSQLYQFFCCPIYGKITDKRVIYTEPNPQDVCFLPECITSFWCQKVETMDYRNIDDISVEQSCFDFVKQTGTIVLHIRGSTDVSIISQERNRLLSAIRDRDLVKLKQAVRICKRLRSEDKDGQIPKDLLAEFAEGEKWVQLLEDEERRVIAVANEKITAENANLQEGQKPKPLRRWRKTYVQDEEEENTAQQIKIPGVLHPFTVMDDLSYVVTTRPGRFNRDHSAMPPRRDGVTMV